MSTNLSAISPLIRPNERGSAIDLVFRDTDLINFLRSKGRFVQAVGGSPHAWNIQVAGTDTSETYVEGQALPLAGTPSFKSASVSASYFRAVAKVSGHVRDQIARGGTYEDAQQRAILTEEKNLYSRIEAAMLGTTVDFGIASVIDAADLYGGINPAVVTEWASLETNVGGALTASVLNIMYRTLTDSPRGATPDTILASQLQTEKYTNLIGPANSTGLAFRPRDEFGKPYDLGMAKTAALSFNGAEWVPIRLMTNTELYMLDIASGFDIFIQRDLEVTPLAKTNDDQSWQLSTALFPVVANRRKQGKLTGLST